MRINSNKIVGLVAVTMGTALLGLNGGAVRADIEAVEGTPTVSTVNGGLTYLWNYDIQVSSTQQVETGDFFTIYDFAGYVGTAPIPAGWTQSSVLVNGSVPSTSGNLNPVDDPGILNFTFTYAGATIPGGPLSLGNFILESEFNVGFELRSFAGRGTDKLLTGGRKVKNGNQTSLIAPGVIPEPGEYAFAAFAGASLLGLVVRARRRNSGVAAA